MRTSRKKDAADLQIDVAVVVEQHSHAVDVLFTHSHVQTRPFILVHHVHPGRGFLQQQLHHRRLVTAAVQRRFHDSHSVARQPTGLTVLYNYQLSLIDPRDCIVL